MPLPRLDERRTDDPSVVTLPIPERGPLDLSPLPAAPGVLILEARRAPPPGTPPVPGGSHPYTPPPGTPPVPGGSPANSPPTILIATTADLRDLARRRLSPEDAPSTSPRAPHVDHRAITARVIAIPVGSGLEADAVYLHHARARLPACYRAVSERWRAWFITADPDAEHPQLAKTNLASGPVARRSASTRIASDASALCIGPLPDKDAAGRLIESLTDAFDLCRFHNLLVQAPSAQACAYKEMGRCPAPCDGSEPMPDYRARVRDALNAATSGRIDALRDASLAAMHAAAARADFESAAAHKARADRFDALLKPAFAHLHPLARWRLLWILPAPPTPATPPTPPAIRPVLFSGLTLRRLPDQPASDPARAAQHIAADLARLEDDPLPSPLTDDHIDTAGLVARWLFKPAKRRAGIPLRLDNARAPDPSALRTAIRSVASSKTDPGIDAAELEA
jgi:hypothetical protein